MLSPSIALDGRSGGSTARLLFALSLALVAAGCGAKDSSDAASTAAAAETPLAQPHSTAAEIPIYDYQVVNAWPHDREAFTQGLVYLKGILIESTGLNGRSTLRKVDLQTGRVRESLKLPAEYFAEGMTVLDGKIHQLTWRNGKGFVYDLATFREIEEFSYAGEGWGLTTDGTSLILSDGTHRIRFLDPKTHAVTRSIEVLDRTGRPLNNLNELEFIRGEIFANVWRTPYVVRIDPASGRLLGVIDFTGLLSAQDRQPETDVLNGIAYDESGDRLFVTGKNWPKLFEVTLTPRPGSAR